MQPAVEVRKPVGVEAELLQDRRMQVFDVEAVFDGVAPQVVGLADAGSSLDSAAGHPHREAISVVITPGALGVFSGGLAAKLASPNDQGLVKQARRLQVFEQAGDRLVGVAGVLGVVLHQVGMSIPVVVVVSTA